MSAKALIFIFMTIGSVVGGYLPVLFGDSMFSLISVLASGAGGILGIFIGYRLSHY